MKTHCFASAGRPRRLGLAGFQRLDLLVVVVLGGVLALLGFVTVANGGPRNGGVVCQYNLGRLTTAWLLYAQEYRGQLPANPDGLAPGGWVGGWLDYSSARDNTNTATLSAGAIWPFLSPRQPGLYRCPEDSSLVLMGGLPQPRVRSYSMNMWLNGRAWTPGWTVARQISDLNQPPPSKNLVLLDEREDSINDGAFAIDMAGYDPSVPESLLWVDYPAGRHVRGANLSLADGHVEHWRWQDERTMPVLRPGVYLPLNVASPGNPDIRRVQAASGARR